MFWLYLSRRRPFDRVPHNYQSIPNSSSFMRPPVLMSIQRRIREKEGESSFARKIQPPSLSRRQIRGRWWRATKRTRRTRNARNATLTLTNPIKKKTTGNHVIRSQLSRDTCRGSLWSGALGLLSFKSRNETVGNRERGGMRRVQSAWPAF